jgi:hypothetical protein
MPEVPGSLLTRSADYPDGFQYGSVLIFQKLIWEFKILAQVTCWGSASIRRQHTKFGRRGDQATWICVRKAVQLQAWSGPEGFRKFSFPDYMTTAQDGGKVVDLTHRPPLTPGNAPGTHFCYRLSRPQGHSAIGRIMSKKNSNDTIWNRNSDLRFVAHYWLRVENNHKKHENECQW